MSNTFSRNLIARLVQENFPAILEHSLRNCHVKGFNSIFLMRSDVVSLRLYVCLPGETELHKGIDPNDTVLMAHNHRFFFQCQTLKGWMQNLIYSESATATDQGLWFKYAYQSAITSGDRKMRLEPQGQVHLALDKTETVSAGQSYAFEADQLHRIVVPNDELVVLLLWEHRRSDHTQFAYSKQSLPDSLPTVGLYDKFEKAALRQLIDHVLASL